MPITTAPPPVLTSPFQNSDVIAIGAAIVSLASLFITLYSSYLNKQLEIKFIKFGKIVIDNLDQLLEPLDTIFTSQPHQPVSNYLTQITEGLVDVELFIIHFQTYYPTLPIKKITESKENFSDNLYNNSAVSLKDSKIPFLAFKTHLYNTLYEFAQNTDIGPLHRQIAKIKSWPIWNFFNS